MNNKAKSLAAQVPLLLTGAKQLTPTFLLSDGTHARALSLKAPKAEFVTRGKILSHAATKKTVSHTDMK